MTSKDLKKVLPRLDNYAVSQRLTALPSVDRITIGGEMLAKHILANDHVF